MPNELRFRRFFTKQILFFIGFSFLSVFFLSEYVNLTPQVGSNFFFASDDPQFETEKLTSKLFVRKDTILIISAMGNLESKDYQKNIDHLSGALLRIRGIDSVKSITRG